MAKAIKFRLNLDGQGVSRLEDLRENFCIEDVLEYYKNGLLASWCALRGYEEELAWIEKISSQDELDIARELVRIFKIANENDEVEQGVYSLIFAREQRGLHESYMRGEEGLKDFIAKYKAGYEALTQELLASHDDMKKTKVAISVLLKTYDWILGLDGIALFYRLYECSPLAIFCLIMHEKIRKLYFQNKQLAKQIINIRQQENLWERVKPHTYFVKKDTGGHWDELQEKGFFMILTIGENCRVMNNKKELWQAKQLVDKFHIVGPGLSFSSVDSEGFVRYIKI